MVPHVAKRGHSFSGAGKYYFHDKKAQTSERVAWVETVNLPTTDPAKAMKCMAWTSMNADAIRALAGGSKRGRKAVQGDVYPLSLSWHPGEKPTDAHMLAKGLEALAELGMSGHQAVLLRHTDTEHPHLHMLVNLVHPETGVRAKISNDRLKLSEWAQGYEIGQDNIVCHKRIENNERRKNGEYVKYRDAGHDHAPTINQLYQSADSGKAFAASVRSELGLTLATGNKGRVVLVDEAGKIVNLARQLEGQRAKDIKAKLADLDLKKLPDAKELADERQQRQEDRKEQRPPVQLQTVGLKGRFEAANDNSRLRAVQMRELEAEILAPRQRRQAVQGAFAAVALDADAWQRQQAAVIEAERERYEESLRTQKRQQRTEAIEAKAAEVYAVRADIQRRHLDDTRDMEVRHRRQTGIRQAELEPVYGRHIKRLEKSIAAARERLETGGKVYGVLFAWRDRHKIEVATMQLDHAREREASAWAPLRNKQKAEWEGMEKSQADEMTRTDRWVRKEMAAFEQSLDAPEREQGREQGQEQSQQHTRGGMGRSRSLGAQASPVKSRKRKRQPVRVTGRDRRKREPRYKPAREMVMPERRQRYTTGKKVTPRSGINPRQVWRSNVLDMVSRKGGAPRTAPAPVRQPGRRPRGPEPRF